MNSEHKSDCVNPAFSLRKKPVNAPRFCSPKKIAKTARATPNITGQLNRGAGQWK